MKWALLFFTLTFVINLSAQDIGRQQLRESFIEATQRKSALDSFTGRLDAVVSKSPVQECYYGICYALKIQYVSATWAKLKLVYQTRAILNHAVERDPADPELRFMRITFEHFLPDFLGLNKDISADLAVILSNPAFVADNPALKKKALEFLISSRRCTDAQTLVLQKQLTELNRTSFGRLVTSSIQ